MLTRLRPGESRTAREVMESLGLRDGPPRVVAVMIASLDGRAAIGGRSVPLGHPDDRALLRELRTAADAILVGTRTLAAERYANLLDPDQRALRAGRGLAPHPLVATVSRRLDLPPGIPLLAEPDVAVHVYTEAEPRDVRHHRLAPLTLPGVVEHLRAELGAPLVVCEGGPALLRELAAQDAVDDLLLTIAPLLAAGDGPSVLTGEALPEPARLRLHEVHRADDHLVLHLRRP